MDDIVCSNWNNETLNLQELRHLKLSRHCCFWSEKLCIFSAFSEIHGNFHQRWKF